ncbi:Glycoprotein-N-acetylgalactosamine 3-beta-galactosyltransferase 1 [Hypsibius exemplaris]|uniref:Glycoprotein-N-acetylgalactosamine 3-beta-galactosyltransferase 1 n=1 Tax=Hypsibius exemplaris TaxID=2072580 RepID=A0A1W0X828_HYPEX|nr:Glycoprotein-N-acetylgalactosamine 3-beta-galactosyltransferase 1 [Hypsibius exemplaris]
MTNRRLFIRQAWIPFLLGFFLNAFIFVHFLGVPSRLRDVLSTGKKFALDSNYADELKQVLSLGKKEQLHSLRERAATAESDDLFTKVRIFCWILTSPNNTAKAQAVKATWAKRCNKYVFVSSEDDPTLPAINSTVGEGRDRLWGKTKFGFRYAYHNSLQEYDWFVKADDDTYMILENLRHLLSAYSPSDPNYFGCELKPFVPNGYMAGGSGYVLSREALRRFVEDGLDGGRCREDHDGFEDVEAGKCLAEVGVLPVDSLDDLGRKRFFPSPPLAHIQGNRNDSEEWRDWWYKEYVKYPDGDLLDCCSDKAISFHYIGEMDMYMMEYLIYRLKPHGLGVVRPLAADTNL